MEEVRTLSVSFTSVSPESRIVPVTDTQHVTVALICQLVVDVSSLED